MKQDEGYISYIVNPKSGSSSSKPIGHEFLSYLRDNGYDVRISFTKSLEHACELSTAAAVDHDCALVVVVGGDGTVREVAHGLEGSDRPLLIVPGGTENLLANELGFDEKVSTTIAAFEKGVMRRLDLGRVNERCFTSVVGFGFDAEVVRRVSGARNGHINHFDYFWPIWRTFWTYGFEPMKVEVDGEEIFEGRGLVFVGNISRYAIGLQLLHYADCSDGLLDVCVFKCASKLRLMKQSFMTVIKQHHRCADVLCKQGKKIRVTSDCDVASEIDGDPGPGLPVEIEIIPQAVNCVVPEGAKPAGMRTRLIRALG